MLVDIHVHWHVAVVAVVSILMTGAIRMKIMFAAMIHEIFSCAGVLAVRATVILLWEIETTGSPVVCTSICVHGIRRKHVVIQTPTVTGVVVIAVHTCVVAHAVHA